MTKDQVIQMAREAGWPSMTIENLPGSEDMHRLHRFANLAYEAAQGAMLEAGNDEWLAAAYAQGQRDMREAAAGCVENANTPDCGGWDASGIAEAIRSLPIKEVK